MAPISASAPQSSVVEPPAPVGPMTLSDILDGSYTIIKRRPRAVIGSVAVIIVPVQVLSVWLQSTSGRRPSRAPYDAVLDSGFGASFGTTLAIAALASLSLFFVGGIVSSFVAAWYGGLDISGRRGAAPHVPSNGTFRRRVDRAVAVESGELRAVHPAAGRDRDVLRAHCTGDHARTHRAVRGIKRSAQLIARRFWPSLGIILLASLVEKVLQFSLSAIPMIIASLLPSPADWMVLAVGEAAAALIATTALVGVERAAVHRSARPHRGSRSRAPRRGRVRPGELVHMGSPYPPADEARQRADEILARPEFAPPEQTLLQRALDWVDETVRSVLSTLLTGSAGSIIAWVVLGVFIVIVVVVASRVLRTVQSVPTHHVEHDARRPVPPSTGRAKPTLEAEGKWKEGLRCRYRALVEALIERDMLRDVPGRTTGEFRRRAR